MLWWWRNRKSLERLLAKSQSLQSLTELSAIISVQTITHLSRWRRNHKAEDWKGTFSDAWKVIQPSIFLMSSHSSIMKRRVPTYFTSNRNKFPSETIKAGRPGENPFGLHESVRSNKALNSHEANARCVNGELQLRVCPDWPWPAVYAKVIQSNSSYGNHSVCGRAIRAWFFLSAGISRRRVEKKAFTPATSIRSGSESELSLWNCDARKIFLDFFKIFI